MPHPARKPLLDPAADRPAPDDEALVALARAGSRRAFEDLVRRYQRPIYFLIERYVRDADEAADIAQSTFIRAHQSLSQLGNAAVFRHWLFRIAVNLSLNWLRDNARFVEAIAPDEGPSVEADGGAELETSRRAAALREAVAQLPPKQRATVELRVFQDLSFAEVAQATGCTSVGARVNYHFAVKNLRELLGAPAPEGRPRAGARS
jgi:RNA polymerase sigma-70 factor (ECF subfamily)